MLLLLLAFARFVTAVTLWCAATKNSLAEASPHCGDSQVRELPHIHKHCCGDGAHKGFRTHFSLLAKSERELTTFFYRHHWNPSFPRNTKVPSAAAHTFGSNELLICLSIWCLCVGFGSFGAERKRGACIYNSFRKNCNRQGAVAEKNFTHQVVSKLFLSQHRMYTRPGS